MYGEDYGYASTRILGTIVRLKDGNPVYIQHMNERGQCWAIPIEKEWMIENAVQVHLDDLDLRPVRLGYVNTGGNASYFQRIPMRRDWKQGLRQENCTSNSYRLFSIPMVDLKNCIINRYPTFAKACEGVSVPRTKGKIIAWHRHWAVATRGEIYYKGEPVGYLVDDKPVLSERFTHLKEYLLETI